MKTLSEIGIKFGTWKSPLLHNYLDFYESAVAHLRFESIKILEIGLANGASLGMLKEYFENAQIHGIDKRKPANLFNCHFHQIDLDNSSLLVDVANKKWDIIIDDASHTMKHQQTVFDIFWPHINKNGFFILEDLHGSFTSGPKSHNPNNDVTTYTMVEALRDKKDFESLYISKESFNSHLEQVNEVQIFIDDVLHDNGKRTSKKAIDYPLSINHSITSIISKK